MKNEYIRESEFTEVEIHIFVITILLECLCCMQKINFNLEIFSECTGFLSNFIFFLNKISVECNTTMNFSFALYSSLSELTLLRLYFQFYLVEMK